MARQELAVIPCFASPMVSLRHPDPAPLNRALRELILACESEGERWRNKAMTGGKVGLFESQFDMFEWPEACVQSLKRFCFDALRGTVQQLSGYADEDMQQLHILDDTWFHVMRFGHYAMAHNHPMASWSGVYCVDPGQYPPEYPDSGTLRFQDARVQASMYLDAGNFSLQQPYSWGNVNIRLQAGQLLLFPSYLVHEVAPYFGQGERITVAFNTMLQGKQS